MRCGAIAGTVDDGDRELEDGGGGDPRRRGGDAIVPAHEEPSETGGADRWGVSIDRRPDVELPEQRDLEGLHFDAIQQRVVEPTLGAHVQLW